MEVFKQLLGRLHPIIIHLPIGFIILGLLLKWYDRKKKEHEKVNALIFLWGGVFAFLACLTGYYQYLSEGYAFDTIKRHLFLGIITAIFSSLMYVRLIKIKNIYLFNHIPMAVFALILFLLVSITGHLGGEITYGENYLVEPLPNSIKSIIGIETYEEKKIALNKENWEEALFYKDVIKSVLNNKCVSCHNPKKAKGELNLANKNGILKGGKNGEIIVSKDPKNSSLFSKLLLPMKDEDHMPPKDKTQLSEEEINLIKTWIVHECSFDKSIKELNLKEELFQPFFPQKPDGYPDIEVNAAPQDSIEIINQYGIHVTNINKTTNFIRVSCINKPLFSEKDFELLNFISQQIAILDLGGTMVSDSIFEKLATLPHLTVLKLNNTVITGESIGLLFTSQHLKSINLSNTNFKAPNLKYLSSFKNLETVYLYNTSLVANGIKKLNDSLTIDYGDYQLPSITSDSIIY